MSFESLSLRPRQQRLLTEWFPDAVVEQDHSWGLIDRKVLEFSHAGERFILKAGGPQDHHIVRELQAHQRWLKPWTDGGFAPVLKRFDRAANLLVTGYLPGRLVLGSRSAAEPESYRQAGVLLAALHAQSAVRDDEYETRQNRRTLHWLDGSHRIAPEAERQLRALLSAWPSSSSLLVPTHGDWQPRNWLIDRGTIRIIDFGRADLRPALTDFARLAAQEFLADPALEEAFLAGYGAGPREPEAWYRSRVREAVGTAAWAYQVGDDEFEAQGHRMIEAVLAERRTQ